MVLELVRSCFVENSNSINTALSHTSAKRQLSNSITLVIGHDWSSALTRESLAASLVVSWLKKLPSSIDLVSCSRSTETSLASSIAAFCLVSHVAPRHATSKYRSYNFVVVRHSVIPLWPADWANSIASLSRWQQEKQNYHDMASATFKSWRWNRTQWNERVLYKSDGSGGLGCNVWNLGSKMHIHWSRWNSGFMLLIG